MKKACRQASWTSRPGRPTPRAKTAIRDGPDSSAAAATQTTPQMMPMTRAARCADGDVLALAAAVAEADGERVVGQPVADVQRDQVDREGDRVEPELRRGHRAG